MVIDDQDGPTSPPRDALGEILLRAYAGDYHADLRFELVSLLLVLAHDSRDGQRQLRRPAPAATTVPP